MSHFEIKSRIVANNILPIFGFGFIIINMDKLKKGLKKLFAPAIVLLLVAVMGVFSPVVSVAAALRLQMTPMDVESTNNPVITNLPARTVKVGESTGIPQVDSVNAKLLHAGKESDVTGTSYQYNEVGQYQWRFYVGTTLFDTYNVNVTDTTYTMTMPSNVVTVAPKGLSDLALPLPASYTAGGETMEIVDDITGDNDHHYAVVKLKNKKDQNDNGTIYHLSAVVALENDTFAADKIVYNGQNITINLAGHQNSTGNLKVTYLLSNDSDKLLFALPLTDIEIKNVNKNDVMFANLPTAPSVANLSYYSSVALTAPTADSAKVGETTFTVEAQTSIVKVQAYLFSTEPSNWKNGANIHNLIVENGVVKENGQVSDLLEVDGLNVKVKALGWYRFQFETSTLFGYKMDKDFNNYDAIEQDENKSYVRYWSDSIRIYRDSMEPNFAWVKDYDSRDGEGNFTAAAEAQIEDYNENFSEHLNDYDAYLPMTEKPDANTAKKITVNYTQGLVLPAIFPHDNATSFADMKVTTFYIEQIQDADGNSVANNYVYQGETSTNNTFKYDMAKHLQIQFQPDGIGSGVQAENNVVVLKQSAGLYRIRIVVEEQQPVFQGNNEKYSGGYAQTKTKYLYFYVASDADFPCGQGDNNSPVIDEGNVFQISDVYLWEGRTFDFPAPSFSDAHTPTDKIQVDYYLVHRGNHGAGVNNNEVVAKLDYNKNASRITVDLDNLHKENGESATIPASYYTTGEFYIYAVARNFNGMQANLKKENGVASYELQDYFSTSLFSSAYAWNNNNEVKQFGYAWKRAKFAFHVENPDRTATLAVDMVPAPANTYVAGKPVKIPSITATWDGSEIVDGQMSFAVYKVDEYNRLTPYDLYNSDDEVISSVAFKRHSYEVNDLYFNPIAGNYILVVTAKDNASNKISTSVTKIKIERSGAITPRPRDGETDNNQKEDKTMTLGTSLTLPGYDLDDHGTPVYVANNRKLFDASTMELKGNYTITLLGVNDPNCITGNKFTPTKGDCTYTFRYNFYDTTSGEQLVSTADYVVRVNSANGSTKILMGETYGDGKTNENKVLWNGVDDASDVNITDYTVGAKTYDVGNHDTGTETKPAYAITLPQFIMSNYGATNDFVLDSASLYPYLEPIYGTPTTSNPTNISGYMYPAIAIPMPNIVAGNTNSNEVEITVQKSGSSTYLVSSKRMNAGDRTDTASLIEKIGDYFVFRPTGKFSTACKDTNHDAQNYLLTANSVSEASGVYTVTYKTNTASASFNITLGNLDNGEISLDTAFLTYDNNKEITNAADKLIIDKDSDGHRYVTIDMRKVFFTGNDDMASLIAQGPNGDINNTDGFNPEDAETAYLWKNATVTVDYENAGFIKNSDWKEDGDAAKIKNKDNYTYKFDLTQGSGTYKVTVKLWNNYTSSYVTKSIEFTLDAESTNKNVNLNTVWGIILIVLSVGLLAGVIFYFVKTARATRFVDAPRATKVKDKKINAKKETKLVATPKDTEAPKDDVK